MARSEVFFIMRSAIRLPVPLPASLAALFFAPLFACGGVVLSDGSSGTTDENVNGSNDAGSDWTSVHDAGALDARGCSNHGDSDDAGSTFGDGGWTDDDAGFEDAGWTDDDAGFEDAGWTDDDAGFEDAGWTDDDASFEDAGWTDASTSSCSLVGTWDVTSNVPFGIRSSFEFESNGTFIGGPRLAALPAGETFSGNWAIEADGEASFWNTTGMLCNAGPTNMSVTYGTGCATVTLQVVTDDCTGAREQLDDTTVMARR
jgi:hypothetical protein